SLSRLFLLTRRRRPLSTLFPYTTLFRSPAVKRHSGGTGNRGPRRFTVPLDKRQGDRTAPISGNGPRDRPDPVHRGSAAGCRAGRSEEHTSELQSRENLVCRLLLEKKIRK